jgi:hypothetical protein
MAHKLRKSRKQSSAISLLRKGGRNNLRRVTEKYDSLDDVIGETARSLGIKIDKTWKAAIRANLQVTLRHGAFVTALVLDDEAEPAPVFVP